MTQQGDLSSHFGLLDPDPGQALTFPQKKTVSAEKKGHI